MEIQEWVKIFQMLHHNETNLLNEHDAKMFDALLVALSKKQNDIRWCSNYECVCHPEMEIRRILENEESLVYHLKHFIDYEAFKQFIYSDYEPITLFE